MGLQTKFLDQQSLTLRQFWPTKIWIQKIKGENKFWVIIMVRPETISVKKNFIQRKVLDLNICLGPKDDFES